MATGFIGVEHSIQNWRLAAEPNSVAEGPQKATHVELVNLQILVSEGVAHKREANVKIHVGLSCQRKLLGEHLEYYSSLLRAS